jgi:hypothetical protein
MATFSQGIELTGITTLTINSNGTSTYNVPAGFYALANYFLYAPDSGDVAAITVNGASYRSVGGATDGRLNGEILAASGQSISITVSDSGDGDSSAHAGIRIYKNP